MASKDTLEEKIRTLKAAEFAHQSADCHRVNNGSFGSAPKCVLEVQSEFRNKWLSQPDEFLYDTENGFWPQIKRSILALAPVVNCPEPYHQHLCLVENATTAANIIAQVRLFIKYCCKHYELLCIFYSIELNYLHTISVDHNLTRATNDLIC